MPSPNLFAVGALTVIAVLPQVDAQPSLTDLLSRAAAYVAAYEAQAATLVMEESYTQWLTPPPRYGPQERRLRSDVAIVNAGEFGWIGFRDVFEVDRKPTRDRDARFLRLFGKPVTRAAIDEAQAIANESARFNLGSVGRNLNYPTMALIFLRQNHQPRSSFSREGTERVGDVATWRLDFTEEHRPTLIVSSGEEAVTSGRYWVEPDAGRVFRTRITVDLASATCVYDVEYGAVPGIDVLVPKSMDEFITLRAKDARATGNSAPVQMIRGKATYSNVRQFKGSARIKGAVALP